MKLTVTNAQRLGVAFWLRGAWNGKEKDLNQAHAIYKAFGMGAVFPLFDNAGGFDDDGFDFAATSEIELDEKPARFLLKHLPAAGVPPKVGPDKVELMQAIRAALPTA